MFRKCGQAGYLFMIEQNLAVWSIQFEFNCWMYPPEKIDSKNNRKEFLDCSVFELYSKYR